MSGNPIPASFYDQDYYEGITSNYTNGYHWNELGQLFIAAARLLTNGLFPEATRFLDFGCAAGFLVRALREHGVEAWGVDHSPYCLEHAEAEAKPYMVASLEDLPRGSTFDVVTAFETLEHLTPAQIAEVLANLRQVTRQALFATMPVTDNIQPRWARELADKDPTHVSLYPRSWWLDQFKTAGFIHGPWQQIAELYCKSHPLCQQAGWHVVILGV